MTASAETGNSIGTPGATQSVQMQGQPVPTHAFVPASHIEDILTPAFYAPEFLTLDAELGSVDVCRFLAECCTIRSASGLEPHHLPTWEVTIAPNSIEVQRCWNVGEKGSSGAQWSGLPARAIVIPELFRGSPVPVFYWDDAVFGGKANISGNALILVPEELDKIFPAMAEVLAGSLAQRQMARLVAGFSGAVMPRIPLDKLGNLIVPRHLPERAARHVLAVAGAKLHASPSGFTIGAQPSDRQLLLTGATVDERIAQLEDYLKGSLPPGWSSFFVQASTSDPQSRLYAIRELRTGLYLNLATPPDEDAADDADFLAWNQWYWSTASESGVQLFNSYLRPAGLPHPLWLRILQSLPLAHGHSLVFPRWRDLADLWTTHAESEADTWAEDLDELIAARNRSVHGVPPSIEDIAASYRPLVAIRIDRDGDPSGAYVLLGDDQRRDPEGAGQRLLSFGMTIRAALLRSINVDDSVVRRESIRRMSWVMHQLASPLMRLDEKLKDIQEWLGSQPTAAAALIPDPERATRRARSNRISESEYTLGAVVVQLQTATKEIKNLQYRVRKLKNANRDPRPRSVNWREFSQAMTDRLRDRIAGLQITPDISATSLWFDPDPIAEALDEVFENALRELRERRTEHPTIDFAIHEHGPWVTITVRDNALPPTERLVASPFDEGVSTYQRANKGTGIGLAATKAAFIQQGGAVELRENTAPDGGRVPGVSFLGRLPINPGGRPHV